MIERYRDADTVITIEGKDAAAIIKTSKGRKSIYQKAGEHMLINEKEYNGYLLDQLSAVERIERQVKKGDLKAVEEEIEILKNEINRKLYQKPLLTGN